MEVFLTRILLWTLNTSLSEGVCSIHRHCNCWLGAIMLASAAICQSIIDLTSYQALVQNFETKCGRVTIEIYGIPCHSDKIIRVRKHCRLIAKQ